MDTYPRTRSKYKNKFLWVVKKLHLSLGTALAKGFFYCIYIFDDMDKSALLAFNTLWCQLCWGAAAVAMIGYLAAVFKVPRKLPRSRGSPAALRLPSDYDAAKDRFCASDASTAAEKDNFRASGLFEDATGSAVNLTPFEPVGLIENTDSLHLTSAPANLDSVWDSMFCDDNTCFNTSLGIDLVDGAEVRHDSTPGDLEGAEVTLLGRKQASICDVPATLSMESTTESPVDKMVETSADPSVENLVDADVENLAKGPTSAGYPLHWCSRCEKYQPLRTKHCKECDRCIRGFDHHCSTIGQCVGEGNRALFVTMVFMQLPEMWLLCLEGLKIFVRIFTDEYTGFGFDEFFHLLFRFFFPLTHLYVAVTLTCYAYYVTACLFNGITTWEDLRWEKISYLKDLRREKGSPFAKSCCWNVSVYCCDPCPCGCFLCGCEWFPCAMAWKPQLPWWRLPCFQGQRLLRDAESSIDWEHSVQRLPVWCMFYFSPTKLMLGKDED